VETSDVVRDIFSEDDAEFSLPALTMTSELTVVSNGFHRLRLPGSMLLDV